jgi:hypothetical protein
VETEQGFFVFGEDKERMKREPSKANGRVAQEPTVATKRERETKAPPPELLVLESCFLDGIECFQLLLSVPIALLLVWEAMSTILKEGLSASRWWERYFAHLHPVTYARIVVDTSRATALLQSCHGSNVQSGGTATDNDLWRSLVAFEQQSESRHCIVWKEQFSGGSHAGARFAHSIYPPRRVWGRLQSPVDFPSRDTSGGSVFSVSVHQVQ